jgi:hypothetical protein
MTFTSVTRFIHIDNIKSKIPTINWIPEPFLEILSSESEKLIFLGTDIDIIIGFK